MASFVVHYTPQSLNLPVTGYRSQYQEGALYTLPEFIANLQ